MQMVLLLCLWVAVVVAEYMNLISAAAGSLFGWVQADLEVDVLSQGELDGDGEKDCGVVMCHFWRLSVTYQWRLQDSLFC